VAQYPAQQGAGAPMITTVQTKAMTTYQQDYRRMKKLCAILHGSINISGGLKFQRLIYEAILASGKHINVEHEYPVQLLKETGEEDRNEHFIDILCEDEDVVLALNSKGKSFNSTETGYGLLTEYRAYKKAIDKKFPTKRVEYIILKDEYDSSGPNMSKYNYLVDRGVPVYNTEKYLIDNYGTDFAALEDTRQRLAVARCRAKFAEFGIGEDTVDALVNMFEVLD
jgi:hypothetical protein